MLPLVYNFCVCRGWLFLDGTTFCPLASIVAFEESSETPTATLLKMICLFSSGSSFFFFKHIFLFAIVVLRFFYNVSRYGFLFIYGVCMYWVRVCMCVEAGEEMSSWKVLSKYVSKYSCPSLFLSPWLLEPQLNIHYLSQCNFRFSLTSLSSFTRNGSRRHRSNVGRCKVFQREEYVVS